MGVKGNKARQIFQKTDISYLLILYRKTQNFERILIWNRIPVLMRIFSSYIFSLNNTQKCCIESFEVTSYDALKIYRPFCETDISIHLRVNYIFVNFFMSVEIPFDLYNTLYCLKCHRNYFHLLFLHIFLLGFNFSAIFLQINQEKVYKESSVNSSVCCLSLGSRKVF